MFKKDTDQVYGRGWKQVFHMCHMQVISHSFRVRDLFVECWGTSQLWSQSYAWQDLAAFWKQRLLHYEASTGHTVTCNVETWRGIPEIHCNAFVNKEWTYKIDMQHDMCDDSAYSCFSKMLWPYQLNRWQEVGLAGRGWVMSKASKAVVQAWKAWTSWFWYSSCYYFSYFSVPFQATELPRSSQGERPRSIVEQIRWSCPVRMCVCVRVSSQDETGLPNYPNDETV